MTGTVVSIDCSRIRDWDSFHDEFASTFGFPDFYGRNMNAWVDCMTSIDQPDDGMTSVHASKESVLTLQLENVAVFRENHPDLYAAIIECSAFVNWRRLEVGEPAVLAISFRN
jgi:RNAse (barnase) inhibitor barstar